MVLVLLLMACGWLFAGAPPAEFTEHVLSAGLAGGSQVVIADLNNDGKPDVIAVAGGVGELVWFENPSWKRHVLTADLPRISNVAAWDVDGDGIPELVVAHEFSDRVETSLGILSVLKHNGDPRQPWKIAEIDRIPTSHRLRFADLAGDGHKRLVNAPFMGLKAGKTPVVTYRPGLWMRETIPGDHDGQIRDLFITDWDGAGRDDILTASSTGIDLFRLGKDGVWTKSEIAAQPLGGTDRIAAGWLNGKQSKSRILAALEPSPGSQVAFYKQDFKGKWQRQVVEDGFMHGGAILAVDLNGDGNDEIVASDQGPNRTLNIYYAFSHKGERWMKTSLDAGGIDAADCAVGDLNSDGRPDIVCIGAATANLKWYENKGPKR